MSKFQNLQVRKFQSVKITKRRDSKYLKFSEIFKVSKFRGFENSRRQRFTFCKHSIQLNSFLDLTTEAWMPRSSIILVHWPVISPEFTNHWKISDWKGWISYRGWRTTAGSAARTKIGHRGGNSWTAWRLHKRRLARACCPEAVSRTHRRTTGPRQLDV